jgi:hypothetical protein
VSTSRPPRAAFYLPVEMQDELKYVAELEGISTSELLRRIIGDWRTQRRENHPKVFRAFTREEMRTVLTNRLLELSRFAISLENDVKDVEWNANQKGQSVEEFIKDYFVKNGFVDTDDRTMTLEQDDEEVEKIAKARGITVSEYHDQRTRAFQENNRKAIEQFKKRMGLS